MSSHQNPDAAIEAAIREAEAATSAEIRVFITRHAPDKATAEAEARRHFDRLGMTRTPLRNAVLIFVAPASMQVVVAADESVRLRMGGSFSGTVRRAASSRIESDPEQAVLAAIRAAARALSRRFPRSDFDRDDFSNAVLRD
jgi:uncharacterized membrane protein